MDQILNSMGINVAAVVWHAANFLILILVLQRFLYRPVIRMLDDRSTRIRDSLDQAESIRAETARLQAEARGILDEARREGQQILAQANRSAEQIMAEARRQAQAEGERDRVFQELREQVADLALNAAGRVVRRSLDDSAHRELVREFLASENGDGARTR